MALSEVSLGIVIMKTWPWLTVPIRKTGGAENRTSNPRIACLKHAFHLSSA